MFYLLVAVSQFIPALQIGYVFTSVAPLVMVLTITMSKEAFDDYKRMRRDRSLNNEKFQRLTPTGFVGISSCSLEVGQIIKINSDQRIPADCVLLKVYDESGSCFLRTDQLDGETDWKLRKSLGFTQRMSDQQILRLDGHVEVEAPRKEIYLFEARAEALVPLTLHQPHPQILSYGSALSDDAASTHVVLSSTTPPPHASPFANDNVSVVVPVESTLSQGDSSLGGAASNAAGGRRVVEGLGSEQTLWCHTVLASSSVLALVVFTGRETRTAMNQSQPRNKIGLFELEVNSLSKQLCFMLSIAAVLLLVGKGYSSIWYVYLIRFILLLSAIVPISLRVNLDMAKLFYAHLIQSDKLIEGTVVRTSTIPEELGRIEFLLSDKTGTLTKNEMIFKRLHIGSAMFASEKMEDMLMAVRASFENLFDERAPRMKPQVRTALPISANSATEDAPLSSMKKRKTDVEAKNSPRSPQAVVSSRTSKKKKNSPGSSSGGEKFNYSSLEKPDGDDDEDENHYNAYFNNEKDEDEAYPLTDTLDSSKRISSSFKSSKRLDAPPKCSKSQFSSPLTSSHNTLPPHVLMELRQTILTLALCHNVNVVKAEHDAVNKNSSSSPPQFDSASLAAESDENPIVLGKAKASSANTDAAMALQLSPPLVKEEVIDDNAIPVDLIDSYQAASPDEVALVSLARQVGLRLVERSEKLIVLETPAGNRLEYEILFCFPFSSETKRMAIIVKEKFTPGQIRSSWNPAATSASSPMQLQDVMLGNKQKSSNVLAMKRSSMDLISFEDSHFDQSEQYSQQQQPIVGREHIVLLVKGAESVMMERLRTRGTEWLGEECDNLARQGLRTLVFGCRELTERELFDFSARYSDAKSSMKDREGRIARCIESIETPLRLLGLSGVEDKLQDDVAQTIESLRHAGVKVWLLTGDKVETAICVAISAGLKPRTHGLMVISTDLYPSETSRLEALERFSLTPEHTVLVMDGGSLATFLMGEHVSLFIHSASRAPSVVCCRCSPTQKAEVVKAIKMETGKRTCAIGDGGNDVAMILAADVGIGIEGKEGKQASLAADFSVLKFCCLTRLLMWHGRNAFVRSSALCQFVVHRGLIISVIQVLFSSIFFFIPLPVFQGALQMGYTTFYTTLPVFALVYDEMLPYSFILQYPELYDSLRKGRQMGPKVFWCWTLQSVYQGSVIILMALILFKDNFMNVVAISFSALVLSELLNVATEVHTWHSRIVAAEVLSLLLYVVSIFFLPVYFDITFVLTTDFVLKVCLIVIASWGPPHLLKRLNKRFRPSQHEKLISVA